MPLLHHIEQMQTRQAASAPMQPAARRTVNDQEVTPVAPRIPASSRRPALSPAAAIRSPFTASSIRRSFMPRPCSIRNVDDYLARRGRYTYGRRGTPTSEALGGALAEIEGPQCAGVALLPSGLAAVSLALLSVAAGRRPRAGHRQCLWADPEILRQRAQPLRRHHQLFRSADRRRHCRADAAQHARRLSRVAGLALVRGAGRAGDRRGGACRAAPSC